MPTPDRSPPPTTARPTPRTRWASRGGSAAMADRVDVAGLRARLSDLLLDHRIPSAAIGVLDGGRVTELATGVASAATRRPATTDTAYQIGSITKTWTALAFLQLVGEGRVGLDDPV